MDFGFAIRGGDVMDGVIEQDGDPGVEGCGVEDFLVVCSVDVPVSFHLLVKSILNFQITPY